MKISKTLTKVLSLLLVVGLILSGCGFSGSSDKSPSNGDSSNTPKSGETAKKPQVLNVVSSAEIPTLDSVHAHDGVAFTVLNNVNEGLYRLGKDHNPIPGIASKHEESADGLTHTFTLRDAKWSNGDPVTAQDFEYAWKRIFTDAGHYNSMYEVASILNAAEILKGEKTAEELGVKALDPKTLEVKLSNPNPLFKSLLTFPVFLPQNQKFVESQGDKYGLEYNTVLFNGPFTLADWKHEQSWQYKKNPDYWNAGEVKLDEINVYVVKESSTELNLYETGKVDRIALSSVSVDQYRSHEDFTMPAEYATSFLRFNHTMKVLNVDVRRGIDMAIDKKGLTDVILNNGARPMYGLVPYEFSYVDGKDFRELAGEYNKGTVEEAKELFIKGLQQAGVEALELSLIAADAEVSTKVAEYVKGQLEQNLPSLKVNINIVPFQERLKREKAQEYEMVVSTWGPDYNDPMTYIDMWITDGSANRMKYSNPEFDALVQKARFELDPKKRFQYMLDAEKVVLEQDAALVPLYQYGAAVLQRKSVKGLVFHPSGPSFTYIWTSIEE
jgi:oligopeptide transport system substrate-binding protein